MTQELKSYLKKVCALLKKKNQVLVYKELRTHFQNQIEDLQKQGVRASDASQQIIKAQPHPYVLGYKMRRAQMSFLRRHFFEITVVSMFVAVVMLFQYIDIVIQKDILPKLDQAIQITAQNETFFENDLKFLARKNDLAFLETPRLKNAATWVYTTMFSKLGDANNAQVASLEKMYVRAKSGELKKDMKFKDEILAVDTDWLSGLDQFDYLDHLAAQDYAQLQNPDLHRIAQIGLSASLSRDTYLIKLNTYASHRALQKCLLGRCEAGLKQLRKVAEIINSTQTLIGQVMAMNLLRKESFLVDQFNIKNYAVVPRELINAYERVSWGWRVIVADSLNKQKVSERWQPYLKPQFGLCASLLESPFGRFNAIGDFLEKRWSFENDYSDRMRNERIVLGSLNEKCHLQFYTKLIETNPAELNLIDRDNQFAWILKDANLEKLAWVNLAAIPYVRSYVGFTLLTVIGGASSWGVYSRLPPKI